LLMGTLVRVGRARTQMRRKCCRGNVDLGKLLRGNRGQTGFRRPTDRAETSARQPSFEGTGVTLRRRGTVWSSIWRCAGRRNRGRMSVVEPVNIVSARFECSALDLEGCPDEILPEFAFIGRSNVGKSSLVNFLTGSTDLAKVSAKPGSTKTLNFFELNRRWRLVDLPGYGYAHIARKDSKKFNKSVMEYLRDRPNLCCVFALVDGSLPPQAIDLEFVEWLAANEVPFVLVFTKSDAASPGTVQANIQDFQSRISSWCDGLPDTLVCSARKLSGRTALLKVIDEALKSVTEGVASETSEEPPKGKKSLPAAPRRRPDRDSARPW